MGSSDVQGKFWGAAPRDWAENEEMCLPFYEALFEAAAVTAGTRLLDAGCGAGVALSVAAARGATASGIDASDGLLSVARERGPAADLRHGDLEALPYPEGAFDVVTAFNSVGFAADPVAALREAKRVTRPGGTVGLVVLTDNPRVPRAPLVVRSSWTCGFDMFFPSRTSDDASSPEVARSRHG